MGERCQAHFGTLQDAVMNHVVQNSPSVKHRHEQEKKADDEATASDRGMSQSSDGDAVEAMDVDGAHSSNKHVDSAGLTAEQEKETNELNARDEKLHVSTRVS